MDCAPPIELDLALATSFADIALGNVVREYPHKLDHVMGSAADVRGPRALHPVFYGSFDWHSCVHMHWLLVRLRNRFPALPQRDAISAIFDEHFTAANISGECAYLQQPASRAFERTYGWSWLLALALELRLDDDADAARWASAFDPLAREFVTRYVDYLPRQLQPIRHGVHPNSAFGVLFALRYARATADATLELLCVQSALRWFQADRDGPVAWEPSGADFLSSVLIEGLLMCEVLPPDEYPSWLGAFLPSLPTGFVPVRVRDRSDPYLVHLDGLNLSRAWCLQGIATALPRGDARIAPILAVADRHLAAGLEGIGSGHYVGQHWLATFATLAMTSRL
jgi:hypothetical protein